MLTRDPVTGPVSQVGSTTCPRPKAFVSRLFSGSPLFGGKCSIFKDHALRQCARFERRRLFSPEKSKQTREKSKAALFAREIEGGAFRPSKRLADFREKSDFDQDVHAHPPPLQRKVRGIGTASKNLFFESAFGRAMDL